MKKQRYFIANLRGFSGCKIKLFFENGDYFVRKISKSPSYNKRLETQMFKQGYFAENMSTANVTAPNILRKGFIKKCFFFDMEYVPGVNLVDYIIDADINELSDISKQLCDIICIMKSSAKSSELNDFSLRTQKKVDEIYSKMVSRKLDSLNLKTLEILKTSIKDMDECNNMKMTFCHGDLTMENIICNKKRYYLIDFLDNYIDHYWFDIVKLFQDIEGEWYKFRNPSINVYDVIPKMIFIKKYLNTNLVSNGRFYKKYHYLLLALTFARILPYAKSRSDIDYLMRMIKTAMVKYKDGMKSAL